MERALPIYRLTINEETEGVDYVALVNSPAIERNFQAFSKPQRFAETAKRVLSGALMLADTPIYRNDERLGEYMVVFDRDTIYKIAQRFFKSGAQHNVNGEHKEPIEGVFMFESYIIDKERGINAPKGFEDIPDGSWFGSFKVDNDAVWNEFITTGNFKGFSVEGNFGMEPVDAAESELAELIVDMAKVFAHKYATKHLKAV